MSTRTHPGIPHLEDLHIQAVKCAGESPQDIIFAGIADLRTLIESLGKDQDVQMTELDFSDHFNVV